MKLWSFYTKRSSGEKFYLRDENENIIVIPAETSEEATEAIKAMYSDDYYELEYFLPASELERIPAKGCWVIWYIDDTGRYCYSNEI